MRPPEASEPIDDALEAVRDDEEVTPAMAGGGCSGRCYTWRSASATAMDRRVLVFGVRQQTTSFFFLFENNNERLLLAELPRCISADVFVPIVLAGHLDSSEE